MAATTYVTVGGETVDYIAWIERKLPRGGAQKILDANPGLAELGAVLPAGVKVIIPDIQIKKTKTTPRIWT